MRTYPIMLDLAGRLAVVVGGGPVGLRKVRSLLEAGARVRLVAQKVAAGSVPPGAKVIRARYGAAHLRGALLVFACTDDRKVNARIAADARKAGALVNAADQPEDCDFFLPAVAGDGDVLVAVGTGGASPALAARLKAKVAAALPPRIGEFAALLSEIRDELRSAVRDPARRMEIMKLLAAEESYRRFLAAGHKGVRRKLNELANPRA